MSTKAIFKLSVCLVVFGVTGLYAQPLMHFTFNDGTTSDWSGNGVVGTLLGDSVIVDDAERGKVVQTNGRGMEAVGPFPFTTEYTIAVWYKLKMAPNRAGRVLIGGGSFQFRTDNQGGNLHHWVEYRHPNFLTKFDTRAEDNPDGQLDGNWHHYVWRLTEDGTFAMYVDGVMAPRRDDIGFEDSEPGNKRPKDFGGEIAQLVFGSNNSEGTGAGGGLQGFIDNIRIYNYAVPEEDIPGLAEEGNDPSFASNPMPEDADTDIAIDTWLSWTPGINAITNDVYLGMSLADVESASRTEPKGVLLAEDSSDSSVMPNDLLKFGETYFWRVDGINPDNQASPWKGEVWEFTVEPYAYPITAITASASGNQDMMGPEKTVDGSGLSEDGLEHGTVPEDMWLSGDEGPHWIRYDFDQVYALHQLLIWNSNQDVEPDFGLGAKDVTVEISLDGETWTLVDTRALMQAPGTAGYTASDVIDLQGADAKALRINIANNHAGLTPQVGLSEVSILSIPLAAHKPSPMDGAMDVDPAVILDWRAGRRAVKHEIYLDSDRAKVVDGSALKDTVDVTNYDTSDLKLELDKEYFWKINEVNDTTTWEGAIWSYKTASCIVLDDMESYSNRDGEQIWATWEDGYENNENGSIVGNGIDFVPERQIVLSPMQSLPLYYDNSTAPTSVATWSLPEEKQDWTAGGATLLVIHVYGDPNSTGGTLYATINDTKLTYQGDVNPLQVEDWTQWTIDLTTSGIKQDEVTTLAIGIDGASAQGVVYVDDVRLYRTQPEPPVVSP